LIPALAVLASFAAGQGRAEEPTRFEWKDGDRVVLIGDTLIERDQKYGYLEALITADNSSRSITFRNLGWSGDSVRGLSRARFGPPAEGWQHLIDHVTALKPTVLIVGYGMADSFDGEAGLPRFVSGLNELLDALKPTKARLILLSPIAHEDLGRPLPDPARHNASLASYSRAIRDVAVARKARFIDLFAQTTSLYQSRQMNLPRVNGFLTDDGLHLTDAGSRVVARAVAADLGVNITTPVVQVGIDKGHPSQLRGTRVSEFEWSGTGCRFRLRDDLLPFPAISEGSRRFVIGGLEPGRYALKVDGRPVARADAKGWETGQTIAAGPEFDQWKSLLETINRKNELYFYRWRPQNETYLFGFRKHEQGNNAREIPLFDPLVEEQEKAIARLKTPAEHAYELTREPGDSNR
jgi:lysophospholipase L1-like esterase